MLVLVLGVLLLVLTVLVLVVSEAEVGSEELVVLVVEGLVKVVVVEEVVDVSLGVARPLSHGSAFSSGSGSGSGGRIERYSSIAVVCTVAALVFKDLTWSIGLSESSGQTGGPFSLKLATFWQQEMRLSST